MALKAPAPPLTETTDRVAALRALVPPNVSVGFAFDPHAAAALIAGADAWYSVLAGLFPAPVVAIRRAVARGDRQMARALSAELAPMWQLFREFSGLRVVYAAAQLAGLSQVDAPRPLLPLAQPARDRIAAVLEALAPRLGG